MGTTNVQGKNYDDEIRSISDQLSGSVKSVNQKTGEEIILSSSDIMHVDESNIVKPISETIGELKNSVADGKATVANAISAKGILATGLETFASLASKISQIMQGSGNAIEEDVLTGKTFSNSSKTNATGTMPNVGSVSNILTTNNQEYTVPKGYHDGTGTVYCKPTNLVAGNIRTGVTVGGVAGSFQGATGTAIASDVIAGKTFSNSSGTNIRGTMVNRGAVNTTLTVNKQSYSIPAGYHNGSGKVTASFSLPLVAETHSIPADAGAEKSVVIPSTYTNFQLVMYVMTGERKVSEVMVRKKGTSGRLTVQDTNLNLDLEVYYNGSSTVIMKNYGGHHAYGDMGVVIVGIK